MAPLSISAARSVALKILLTAVHALPVMACLSVGVPVAVRVCVITAVLVSAVLQLRVQRQLSELRLHLLPDGEIQLERSGVRQSAQLQSGAVDMGWLVVLAWRVDGGRVERCALTPDGLGDDAWRALKIWLRWRPVGDDSQAG